MARKDGNDNETVYYDDDDSTTATNDSTDRLTLSGDKADDKAVRLSEVHKKTD